MFSKTVSANVFRAFDLVRFSWIFCSLRFDTPGRLVNTCSRTRDTDMGEVQWPWQYSFPPFFTWVHSNRRRHWYTGLLTKFIVFFFRRAQDPAERGNEEKAIGRLEDVAAGVLSNAKSVHYWCARRRPSARVQQCRHIEYVRFKRVVRIIFPSGYWQTVVVVRPECVTAFTQRNILV